MPFWIWLDTVRRRMKRSILFLLCLFLSPGLVQAQPASLVPAGNRYPHQPDVPGASAKRTAANKTSYEAKYHKVYTLLKEDRLLQSKIREVAAAYGIDPIHVVGAIVGEHTYNVDAYDRLQTYYVKAISYLGNELAFRYAGEDVADFVSRPQFARCASVGGSYETWNCRESVWNSSFRGRTVDGRSYPDDRFSATFFQPFYAGQTFGIGQVNPLTALEMSDLVSQVSGLPELDAREPQRVYQTIMDPDLTLPYVAATVKKAIDAYRTIAGFDISQNPGITATLYNVGDCEARAHALKDENQRRTSEGLEPRFPEENYYGWLVNERLTELRTLF